MKSRRNSGAATLRRLLLCRPEPIWRAPGPAIVHLCLSFSLWAARGKLQTANCPSERRPRWSAAAAAAAAKGKAHKMTPTTTSLLRNYTPDAPPASAEASQSLAALFFSRRVSSPLLSSQSIPSD